ncbi:MAG TPA: glycosyltransferase family 10 [Pyrinomonadaceae bacterium]|nr:glycosyltransferase family 10 [Pyrinomonadaceae bacterium]
MKKEIRIKFANGLSFASAVKDILGCVSDRYEFIDSERPDYLVFGPYGDNVSAGDFVKVGYYCENMKPDMTVCDWAFGMRYEAEVNDPRYMRIQWHGFDPNSLVKNHFNVDEVVRKKTRFCNFVYSNPVPFRERFCTELSKYKRVDAPGKSMNNMGSIDSDNGNSGDMWQRKRAFISQYKFTIAFENASYSGYHTEKLLDPMMVDSLPIYWGNPRIDRHFNTKSFVNSHEQLKANGSRVVGFLEANCQKDFSYAGADRKDFLSSKVKRKLKDVGQAVKLRLQYDANFDQLIDRIVEIDRDDSLYARYLSEPWFKDNKPPSNEHVVQRWREIFG